jgi:hypothetical protein
MIDMTRYARKAPGRVKKLHDATPWEQLQQQQNKSQVSISMIYMLKNFYLHYGCLY